MPSVREYIPSVSEYTCDFRNSQEPLKKLRHRVASKLFQWHIGGCVRYSIGASVGVLNEEIRLGAM